MKPPLAVLFLSAVLAASAAEQVCTIKGAILTNGPASGLAPDNTLTLSLEYDSDASTGRLFRAGSREYSVASASLRIESGADSILLRSANPPGRLPPPRMAHPQQPLAVLIPGPADYAAGLVLLTLVTCGYAHLRGKRTV